MAGSGTRSGGGRSAGGTVTSGAAGSRPVSSLTDKQIDRGLRVTYKAQGDVVNNRLGRFTMNRGNTEVWAKERRMSARLNARRDALFKERNRREDEKRSKIRAALLAANPRLKGLI